MIFLFFSFVSCGNHLGWKFTSTISRRDPQEFWGLARRSLADREAEEIERELEAQAQAPPPPEDFNPLPWLPQLPARILNALWRRQAADEVEGENDEDDVL